MEIQNVIDLCEFKKHDNLILRSEIFINNNSDYNSLYNFNKIKQKRKICAFKTGGK